MIGQTVGNYRIVELIGEGGMGVVYMAEHPAIGRRAAVKVLNASMAQNAEIVTRFFNEARAANAVRHPGIVQVFDFGTLPTGASYIIMELLEGESLGARLKRVERLDVATAVDLACQAADVLAATHQRGIVHRDLKPDNLFLVPDARGRDIVKVLDFGIAKLNVPSTDPAGVRTRTGAIIGTPRYMSPEQCRGTREVDLRTDIYALGTILYQMLCGWPPFTSEGHGELIHLHIAVQPQPPRSYRKEISPALEAVVLKALAKEPSDRQQSMGELQEALRTLPALTDATAPPVRTPPPERRSSSTLPSMPVAGERAPSAFPVASGTTFSSAIGAVETQTLKVRRSRWPALAALAVLVGGAAVGARVVLSHRASSPPAPAPAAPEVAAPAPPPAPAPISVAITSEPPGARVVRARDGADIGVTPFKEAWPAGTGTESLRLERPGYRPEPVVVPLDRGVDLRFALEKVPEPLPEKKHVRPTARTPRPAPPPPGNGSPPAPAPKPEESQEPVPL